LLSPEVAYLKLSSVKIADAATYINKASGTKGLVIDIRIIRRNLWSSRWANFW
jgi:hypothetical protein